MTTAGPVLILDDDPDVLKAARLAIAPDAAHVETLGSPSGLEAALAERPYEAVLVDMNFVLGDHSGREGLDALDRIQAADPTLAVVLMTAYGGVSLAVDALKRGACDFVLKPWRNDKLAAAVRAAAVLTRARREAERSFNLDRVERRAIERAMARYDGNVSQAAAALGLTRPALYRRLVKHGL
ncbi:MAG TPA: response regulator [Caulobacteraceae bacterium]|jgi:DNA-binding NtrC family response regulator|nr:response regulator [Caulobacteraceae bacterium]